MKAAIKGTRITCMFPARKAGAILAFFDIAVPITGVGPVIVRRCRLVRQEEGFRAMGPVEQWMKDGEQKHRVLAVFPHDLHAAVRELAVAAWLEYERSGSLPQMCADVAR